MASLLIARHICQCHARQQNPAGSLLQASEQPATRFVMTADCYLKHDGQTPLDAEEIKEAVRDLLLSSGPPALIRVIGRTAYQA